MTRLEETEKGGESSYHAPLAFALTRVGLENFRNYQALSLDLDPGFDISCRSERSGEDELSQEALYLLSTTRLLRGQRDAEAIREVRDARKSALLLGSIQTLESSSSGASENGLH